MEATDPQQPEEKSLVTDGGTDSTGSDRTDVQACDWECRGCGVVWTVRDSVADDASLADLPEYCSECGDTPGWENRKTGRKVPEPLTDGGEPQESELKDLKGENDG